MRSTKLQRQWTRKPTANKLTRAFTISSSSRSKTIRFSAQSCFFCVHVKPVLIVDVKHASHYCPVTNGIVPEGPLTDVFNWRGALLVSFASGSAEVLVSSTECTEFFLDPKVWGVERNLLKTLETKQCGIGWTEPNWSWSGKSLPPKKKKKCRRQEETDRKTEREREKS